MFEVYLSDHVDELASTLRQLPLLTAIDLSECGIADDDSLNNLASYVELIGAIIEHRDLTTLALRRCELFNHPLLQQRWIDGMVCVQTKLEEIDMSANKVEGDRFISMVINHIARSIHTDDKETSHHHHSCHRRERMPSIKQRQQRRRQ